LSVRWQELRNKYLQAHANIFAQYFRSV